MTLQSSFAENIFLDPQFIFDSQSLSNPQSISEFQFISNPHSVSDQALSDQSHFSILKTFSNDLLLEKFTRLVKTERKITHLVLQYIAEIDHRKLYLSLAYPSLFEYLTEAHGYSAGAAQRRISAARLLQEVPEVAAKIEEGKLTLSQIALATQTIKLSEKKFSEKMNPEDKLELIEKIESQSFVETQKILAKELKVEAPKEEKVQHHADGSVTITLTLTKEQHEDWLRATDLSSHLLPNRKYAEVAHYLAKREILRRTEIKRASPSRLSSKDPRQIKPNLRKALLGGGLKKPLENRHQESSGNEHKKVLGSSEILKNQNPPGCAYTDPRTGKVCGSKHLPQIDHILPVHRGGTNHPRNLRILCAAHNRFRNWERNP